MTHIINERRALDYALLQEALRNAYYSPDPNTKVGAVLVPNHCRELQHGHNRFPWGIEPTPERINNRETKLRMIVHAEMVALLGAAADGVSTHSSTLYLAATDDTGEIWGGPPCTRCTVELIQAGVQRIVSYPQKPISKWFDDLNFSRNLLREAKVELVELPLLTQTQHQAIIR